MFEISEKMKQYLMWLGESPANISAFSFAERLDRIGFNHEQAKQAAIHITNWHQFSYEDNIVHIGNHGDVYYILDEPKNYILAKYMADEENGGLSFKDVWNTQRAAGIARFGLFQYFLKHYGLVQSDAIHTPSGRQYWTKLITQAKQEGCKCFVVNVLDNSENRFDLSDIDSYWDVEGYKYAFKIYAKSHT